MNIVLENNNFIQYYDFYSLCIKNLDFNKKTDYYFFSQEFFW